MLISGLCWGETLEKVIADANLYTVKIDVSTEMPFIEDSWYGSGTGFLVDKDLGPKATPQDIAVSFVGFSMVRMYQRLEEGDEQWVQSLNLVYDSYFTKERIDKYNSFKIIK